MTLKVRIFLEKYKFFLCFALIVVFKFVLAGLFSSDYQDKLFMPFVQGWLKNGGNPYDYFSGRQMFPYPPLMLFVESIGGILSLLVGKHRFLSTALFKVPLLVADILCFYFLSQLFPNKKRQITAIYFCSPILIYSTFMHGQLDIIPTALLTGSIYFLLSHKTGRLFWQSLFVSAALCAKFHILAIMPIFFMFVAKREGCKKALLFEFFVPLFFVFVCMVTFWGNGFLTGVLLNKEQSVLTKISFDFVTLKVYIPILAMLLIYLRMMVTFRVNDELLYGFSAVLFSVFLILVPPMPGWYVWVLPFLVIFYIDINSNRFTNFLVFSLLNFLYLLYFFVAHKTDLTDLYFFEKSFDFLKVQNQDVRNMFFTALFSVHVYVVYYIYSVALKGNSLYRRQNSPFVIGISGDSGSGKTTLISIFKTLFGEKKILTVECDGDHKWARDNENWKRFTHLNPLANFLYRQANDIALLKSGKSVFRSEYNHKTGDFDSPCKVLPKPYILVTGLHSLYLPQLRRQEDLKIYMDIDERLRRFWKIRRDVGERGHSFEDVMAQIESRMDDFHKYIEPQKEKADLLIHYYDKNLCDITDISYVPRLSLTITAVTDVDFEPLVRALECYNFDIQTSFSEDMASQSLAFECNDFEANSFPVMDVVREVVPGFEYILRKPIEAKNNMWSIIGIVILMMVDRSVNEKTKRW